MRCRYVRNGQCNNRATDEIWCADHAQRGKLAAAQAAVVKAAMDAWRAGAFGTRSLEDMVANAACADLKRMGG